MGKGILSEIYSGFAKSAVGRMIARQEIADAIEKGGAEAGELERKAWSAAAEGNVKESWARGVEAMRAVSNKGKSL